MTDDAAHLQSPLLLACRDVGRAMDLFDEAAAGALGVGRSDLRALNLLEHGPLPPAALADRLGLTRAAVTAVVDRLVAAGYVARHPSSVDRRSVLVELQPATWQAFARVYRPLGERVLALTDGLGDRDREVLRSVLADVAGAFDEQRAGLAAAGTAEPAGPAPAGPTGSPVGPGGGRAGDTGREDPRRAAPTTG